MSLTVNSFSPANYCVLPGSIQKAARCREYQCANEFCSTNENKCKAFIGWTALLDRNVSFLQKMVKMYPRFVLSIKECKSSQYVMLKSEVCHNKKICSVNKLWVSRLMFKAVALRLKKQCPCKDKYGYDCVNKYCAVKSMSKRV